MSPMTFWTPLSKLLKKKNNSMRLIYLLIFMVLVGQMNAQELLATVKVATPKLQKTDPKVFKTMEQAIQDYLNSQKWTDDYFENEERIKCSFQITIKEEPSDGVYKADLAIKSTRPIYGSDQETVLFSHLDKELEFAYQEFQPIQFVANSFSDELSQALAFYAYIIIGLDYDSFSKEGGSPYFQEAGNIVSLSPRENPAWNPSKSRNRYAIFESITNARSIPYRKAMYEYHRLGLDIMATDAEGGRNKIMDALEKIDQVNSDFLNAYILQIFANSKSTELVEIFKQAPSSQKTRFQTIMTKIDATKARIFRQVGR